MFGVIIILEFYSVTSCLKMGTMVTISGIGYCPILNQIRGGTYYTKKNLSLGQYQGGGALNLISKLWGGFVLRDYLKVENPSKNQM